MIHTFNTTGIKRLPGLRALLFLLLLSCAESSPVEEDMVTNQFPEKQKELVDVVNSIIEDAETANLDNLKDIHLDSDKFTKFGPRDFQRQDIVKTNESELAFFGSVSNYNEQITDLKIDVLEK